MSDIAVAALPTPYVTAGGDVVIAVGVKNDIRTVGADDIVWITNTGQWLSPVFDIDADEILPLRIEPEETHTSYESETS